MTSSLAFRFCIAGCLSLPGLSVAQNPSAAYDVSSIKPHDAGDRSMSWSADEDGFRAINVTLKNVISDAWGLRPDQVSGEPAWTDDLHWDIVGKSTELTPEQLKALTPEQRGRLMQQLLAERFHLKAHLEARTGAVFTLVPGKGGVKLKPIAMTEEEKTTGKIPGSGMWVNGGQAVVMEAKKVSLPMLIGNLALNLHQTVIDRTGLPADAVYDFKLRFAPDNGPEATTGDALPLRTALEDQLGLHLEAGKGPVQVLVVDHVEKPTQN